MLRHTLSLLYPARRLSWDASQQAFIPTNKYLNKQASQQTIRAAIHTVFEGLILCSLIKNSV